MLNLNFPVAHHVTFSFLNFFYYAGFDAFGDILQPQKSNIMIPGANPTKKSSSPLPSSKTSTSSSLIKGDLDSSLASLAQNLDIKGPKGVGFKKF